jgi:hypothetical protein
MVSNVKSIVKFGSILTEENSNVEADLMMIEAEHSKLPLTGCTMAEICKRFNPQGAWFPTPAILFLQIGTKLKRLRVKSSLLLTLQAANQLF